MTTAKRGLWLGVMLLTACGTPVALGGFGADATSVDSALDASDGATRRSATGRVPTMLSRPTC